MSPDAADAPRVVLLALSPRVAPGLLSWPAWDLLRAGHPVTTSTADHPHLHALSQAGVPVEVVADPAVLPERARQRGGTVVWLAGARRETEAVDLAAPARVREAAGADVDVEVLAGSADLPGARLLDAVAVMDRLRSPGGCPWDAEQTHASLAPYLLEEAYEAYQALEDADADGLREELGDLLLQVLFHARLGEEEEPRWSVDAVATGLVDKLVGRHPHVFGDATVADAAHIESRWEELKAAEKQRQSVTDGVPLAMASLALAAKLQRRARKVGLPEDLLRGSGTGLGAELWGRVADAVEAGEDAETALRATARAFRDRLAAAERAVRADGGDPASLEPAQWRERW